MYFVSNGIFLKLLENLSIFYSIVSEYLCKDKETMVRYRGKNIEIELKQFLVGSINPKTLINTNCQPNMIQLFWTAQRIFVIF